LVRSGAESVTNCP